MICTNPAMAASHAKKLTDLSCEAGQTIVFDGTDWQCADVSSVNRSNTYTVISDTVTSSSGAAVLVIARCEDLNDIVLSGGYFFVAGSSAVFVGSNQPNVDVGVPLGWEVLVNNPLGLIDAQVVVRALCLRSP
jgi:hypothetical protein